MTPEQNKNPNNVIDLQQKRAEKEAAQLALLARIEKAEPRKPRYRLRQLMAASAIALAGFGVGKLSETDAVPKAVAATETFVGDVTAPVADLFHETSAADLTGRIPEVMPANGTLEQLARKADPDVDPRVVESALASEGITPENVEPGQTVNVPVTPEAEAAHDAAVAQNK